MYFLAGLDEAMKFSHMADVNFTFNFLILFEEGPSRLTNNPVFGALQRVKKPYT